METMTRVVGVIPVHQHEHWVAGAVLSMARQTHPPVGIVVVDDGSTDGSVRAVQGLLVEGRVEGIPLHFLHNACPLGPAAARNAGARLATQLYGPELFAFLDSDDEYHPEKISRSVQAWHLAPEAIGCVYSDYTTLNAAGERRRQYKEPFSLARLRSECLINMDSLVSRAMFEWVGGLPEGIRVAEDYAFWLRGTQKFLAYHLSESLVDIRIGGHSSSATIPPDKWRADYRSAFVWAGLIPA